MKDYKNLTAKDIMQKEVITVTPDTSVEEIGRIFIEKDISGLPVIDEYGNLYGIVTENDLISMEKPFHIPTIIHIFDAFIPLETDQAIEKEIRKLAATIVDDICTTDITTVNEDTPFQEIAVIMIEKKIHLLPVLSENKLVGIIGKKDMIKAMAG
ncbi:MAG: CBS domain-containing protein [Nitrospirae bacterium]|nr:CBS domain-containing protein [Nitrospirota bacterium]MBF0540800.1 CBS domain-containing protein [Nitrospirota bacterium]